MTRFMCAASSLAALITFALMTSTACGVKVPINATLQIPAFTSIRSCLPITVLVLPPAANAVNTSTATVTADPHVISAISLTVDSNGVLAMSVLRSFKTNNAIKLTITPATSSSVQYMENDGSGDLILGPGSTAPKMTFVAAGTSNLLGYGITAASVSVSSSGTGSIMMQGSFGTASVRSSGTGQVFLIGGVTGLVQIDASGIGRTFVEGTPSTVLQGSVQGLSKVLYTQGTCMLQGQFNNGFNVFGSPCQQVPGFGNLGFNPVWSCGLVVDGYSSCTDGPTANTTLPWILSNGTSLARSPTPMQAATNPNNNVVRKFSNSNNNNNNNNGNNNNNFNNFNNNGNNVFSSSSGGGNSFSSSFSSGGGNSMTSTSSNGGPAVVTVNGQVVSSNNGFNGDEYPSQQQNSNGLAVASISCRDATSLQIEGL